MRGTCCVPGCGQPLGLGRHKYCHAHGQEACHGYRGHLSAEGRNQARRRAQPTDDAPDPTRDGFLTKDLVLEGRDISAHRLAIRLLRRGWPGNW